MVALEMTLMSQESAYTVKVGDAARKLGLKPMDLVRLCDIAVNTAYQAYRNEHIKLDTCLKIYNGLKKAGYEIRWEEIVQVH